MKLLSVSDLHARPGLYRQLAFALRLHRPDLLVLVGDFLDAFPARDLLTADAAAQLFATERQYFRRLILIPGNHDNDGIGDFEEVLQRRRVCYLKLAGQTAQFDGVTLAGFPCGIGRQDHWPSKAKTGWLDAASGLSSFWFCHEPPAHSPLAGKSGTDIQGSQTIERLIETYQPAGVIAGHQHCPLMQRISKGSTTIINTGQPGERLRYALIAHEKNSRTSRFFLHPT